MTNRMWGGRFVAGPAEIMQEINASIGFDKRSAPPGHPRLAGACRDAGARRASSPREDATAIERGPRGQVAAEIESGGFTFSRALEDIHMNVESRLAELIGPPAGRLHTARSRNDQVATDFRLWVRDAIDALDGAARGAAARRSPRKARAHRGDGRCRASRICSRRSR